VSTGIIEGSFPVTRPQRDYFFGFILAAITCACETTLGGRGGGTLKGIGGGKPSTVFISGAFYSDEESELDFSPSKMSFNFRRRAFTFRRANFLCLSSSVRTFLI
jgi:hypothetical protein